MLGSGLPPLLIPLSGTAPIAGLLRPGQSLQATVQEQNGALFLKFGTQRLPLDAGAGLQAGQQVSVRAEATAAGLRLLVQPAPLAATAPAEPSALGLMISNVLKAMGLEGQRGNAARLLPPAMPATEARIAQLLALFTRPSAGSRDLQSLMQSLQGAAAAGAYPADQAVELARWLLPEGMGDARDLRERLLRFARARAPEARLAAMLADGLSEAGLLEFRSMLRQQLADLLVDDALMAYLKSRGESKSFAASVLAVLDRWQGSDLQNLHEPQQPYVFVELPAGGDVRYARLHFFGDSGSRKGGRSASNATAVIDVSLSVLGCLWIELKVQDGHCHCTLQCADDVAHAALQAEVPALQGQLDALGYTGVTIRVGRWDGDALRATAHLMQNAGPLDVRA